MSHGKRLVNTSTNAQLENQSGALGWMNFFHIGGTHPIPSAGRMPAKTRFARIWTSRAVPSMSFTSRTAFMMPPNSVHGLGSLSTPPTSSTSSLRIVAVSTLDIGLASMRA